MPPYASLTEKIGGGGEGRVVKNYGIKVKNYNYNYKNYVATTYQQFYCHRSSGTVSNIPQPFADLVNYHRAVAMDLILFELGLYLHATLAINTVKILAHLVGCKQIETQIISR